jgi:hypothetical protein
VRWRGSHHSGVPNKEFGRGNDPCQFSAREGAVGRQRLIWEHWLYCFRVDICDLLPFSASRSAVSFSLTVAGQAVYCHNQATQSWRHVRCQYDTPSVLLDGLSYVEDLGTSTQAILAVCRQKRGGQNTIFNCFKIGILTQWNIDKSFTTM